MNYPDPHQQTPALSRRGIVSNLVGYSVYGAQISGLGMEGIWSSPQILGLTIGIIAPILLFWGIAVLVWRGQEMRMVSRTMTEVALRLAEPENIAKESVVTVSQAIRRQSRARSTVRRASLRVMASASRYRRTASSPEKATS